WPYRCLWRARLQSRHRAPHWRRTRHQPEYDATHLAASRVHDPVLDGARSGSGDQGAPRPLRWRGPRLSFHRVTATTVSLERHRSLLADGCRGFRRETPKKNGWMGASERQASHVAKVGVRRGPMGLPELQVAAE